MRHGEPIHILMRFSDKLHSVEDTIAEHNGVIERYGMVWIGKLGKPLAGKHVETINEQSRRGVPSYLFLVQKVGAKYAAYRGTVLEMARTLPRNEEHLVPTYYRERDIMGQVGFWTKLSRLEPLADSGLSELHIITSGLAVPHTLATSIAALFVIREGAGLGPLC